MSTLILADVSLSTEAGITQEARIIDMIKDGLIVFSESLERLQDRFAIYAFSSLKNTNVRFEIIKNFKEKYSSHTRGRIDSMKPGYYTRLGAAIRESSKILDKQQSQNKLLLIISDGKPNDVDRYDGRYGIEDTKKAIEEVKQKGITPFCITVDLDAKEYFRRAGQADPASPFAWRHYDLSVISALAEKVNKDTGLIAPDVSPQGPGQAKAAAPPPPAPKPAPAKKKRIVIEEDEGC